MTKEIQGYEGLYEITDKGEVFALDRYNTDKNGLKKFYPGKQLKLDLSVHGYYRVTLSKNGRTKRFSVHRLVAETFIPTGDKSLHVNHIDNCRTNNTPENLEWCTHSENMIHAQKQGRLFDAQSAGGTKGSATNAKKRDEKIAKLIGTTIGTWKVLGRDETKQKTYVWATCLLCDRDYSMYIHTVLKADSCCRSCGQKKRRR